MSNQKTEQIIVHWWKVACVSRSGCTVNILFSSGVDRNYTFDTPEVACEFVRAAADGMSNRAIVTSAGGSAS